MLNVLFDETMDGQTTVSRHKKPLTVSCSQEWFYNIIYTTECLQNDKKRAISKLEHTLVRFTPLCKLHTADDLKLAIPSSTFLNYF